LRNEIKLNASYETFKCVQPFGMFEFHDPSYYDFIIIIIIVYYARSNHLYTQNIHNAVKRKQRSKI